MRLAERKALVTGADSGIGQAIAIAFANEGADVLVHYHRDQAGADHTASEVRRAGCRAEILQADFEDPRTAQELFRQALALMGRFDIVVNNAGVVSSVTNSLDTRFEEFTKIINVDLVAPWLMAQAAARHMAAHGGGSIINITSVHEEIVLPGAAAYDAAKAGLRSVTRTLAFELAAAGVRINNIAPGMIATPMTAEVLADPQQAAKSQARIPMGRAGKPQEIARLAVFLASDDASYVTGSSYFIDGGLSLNLGGSR